MRIAVRDVNGRTTLRSRGQGKCGAPAEMGNCPLNARFFRNVGILPLALHAHQIGQRKRRRGQLKEKEEGFLTKRCLVKTTTVSF